MKQNKFPSGWNERKVRKVLKHYESQTEEQAGAEDEAAFELKDHLETIKGPTMRIIDRIERASLESMLLTFALVVLGLLGPSVYWVSWVTGLKAIPAFWMRSTLVL